MTSRLVYIVWAGAELAAGRVRGLIFSLWRPGNGKPMQDQDDELKPLVVSYAEAGRLLMGASERTMRRMVAEGKLPTVRVRSRIGIPYAALEEYVQKNTYYSGPIPYTRRTRTTGPIGGGHSPTSGDRLAELLKRKPPGKKRTR